MKTIGVIPARFKSSRFPGKPLVDICGRPMIWWVYQQCIKVDELHGVFVATDDKRIFDTCQELKLNVVMTSTDNKTGSDRVAEASEAIEGDLFVNIQGDEPLIEPDTIRKAIEPFLDNPDMDIEVTNLITQIHEPVDLINFTVPKVIASEDGRGVYLTRSAAPFPKGNIDAKYYKQVCVYGFTPKALRCYCSYGKTHGKAKIEAIEDIEILRFIENGYRVQYIEVDS